jgi:glutathione synthase/RimK-type ligase-like ATP-grasp enzyme
MPPSTYPDQARFVSRVCQSLGYKFEDLDRGGGYLFSVSNGTSHFVSGAGWICTYPLNSAPAFAVSRDKAHTNAVLERAGIPVIPSKLYFITDYHAKLRPPGQELSNAIDAFSAFSGPVFCKPNTGSRGDFAEMINGVAEFKEYVERVHLRYDAILIQPILNGDEYRIFCIDDEVIFATQKTDFVVTGDGLRDLTMLLRDENAKFVGIGISPISESNILDFLAQDRNMTPTHVLSEGEKISLPGRRNLSAGSEVHDFTTEVRKPLADLALRAANAIGIRVSGVDIFDVSPNRDLSDLVIIEVNGNPAISSLTRIGRDDVADRIWHKVLLTYFGEIEKTRSNL